MHRLTHNFLLFTFLFFTISFGFTQELKGIVYDKKNNEPLPFASVLLKKSRAQVTTDFDGAFSLPVDHESDTLIVSTMGYTTFQQVIYKNNLPKNLTIYLEDEGILLEETVIHMGENPAIPIMRKVIANKKNNDPEKALKVSYQKYSRLEVDIDNITAAFKEKKMFKKLNADLESVELLKDSLGNEYMPFLINEAVSEVYKTRKPLREKEITIGTQLHGVGMEDAKFWTQFTGTYFTNFNFYDDLVIIIDKDFHSPITNSWKAYYDYYLMDSSFVDGKKVYEIAVEPKRKYDLAFTGTIWIYDSTFALQKIDLKLLKTANINFLDNIYIQMDWLETDSNRFWLNSSFMAFDVTDVSDNWIGFSGKLFSKYSNIKYEAPENAKFYKEATEIASDAEYQDSTFWKNNSPQETVYDNDQEAMALIQSVKELPTVKSYIDILKFLVNAHLTVGKFDIGPVSYLYANNEVEGHRVQLGGKTNMKFSKKIQFTGYAAYGSLDKRWKYSIGAQYYFSRKQWTYAGFKHRNELDLLGITGYFDSNFFSVFTKWGSQVGGYYKESFEGYFFRQLSKSFSTDIKAINYTMDPVFDYNLDGDPTTNDVINTTEISVNLHFGYREKFIVDDFNRMSIGSKIPMIDLKYTQGLSNVFGSDYNYHKLDLKIEHAFPLGNMGESDVWIRTGKIFNTLPYPLLNIHLGNQTFFYAWFSFNMMNYFEFISDQYASMTYVHHFNGYILNRIPLMKRLKWRTVVNFSVLQGSVNQKNIDIIPQSEQNFNTFSSEPYMEVGYGVENIFKVLRIQAFHRLTYKENPGAQIFAIKGTFQFSF